MARRKKDISITQVAEKAKVSVATVTRVFNHRTDVSEKVRKRVQEVIKKINFSPDKSSERRLNIGVIVSIEKPAVDEYLAQVLDGVTRYSGESNLDATIVINCVSFERPSLIQIIRERRCDAVVLVSPEKIIDEIKALEKASIPTMMVNYDIAAARIGYINNKSYSGALAATSYLIQLGHKKIGFLCSTMKNSVNHQERLQGYMNAMRNSALNVKEKWIIEHQPTQRTPEAGYKEAQKLLSESPEVTAIFAMNDEMAFGAIKACWDRGLKVPDDISIIGFDDIPFSSYMHPALSTVRQPISELGYRATKYLALYLKGEISRLPREELETELIIRQSTAPVKN